MKKYNTYDDIIISLGTIILIGLVASVAKVAILLMGLSYTYSWLLGVSILTYEAVVLIRLAWKGVK